MNQWITDKVMSAKVNNIKTLIFMLRNANTVIEIDIHRSEIAGLIPEVSTMFDYDQQNHAHQYDLWIHSLHSVIGLPKDIDDDMVYLAMLLHDIGKPYCQTYDELDGKPNMHYYGHPEKSEQIVREKVIPRLDLSEDEKRRLLYYVRYHDDRVSLRMKHLRRHLKIGASLKEFQNLMKMEVSDAKAHVIYAGTQERIDICEKLSGDYAEELYNKIRADK